jgi:hypothetical protein
MIDHWDTDGKNNRWVNIREADNSNNQSNRGAPSNNTSGYKGVSLDRVRGTWRATLEVRKKSVFVGRFPTALAAHEAIVKAAKEHFGEFARAA